MTEGNKELINRSIILWLGKTLVALIAVKISMKYWMIPDMSIFYWSISGILIYSWNSAEFGTKNNKVIIVLWAVLLSIAVLVTYMVKKQFVMNFNINFMIDLAFLWLVSWIIINSFCMLFDWISSKNFVNYIDLTKIGIGTRKEYICVLLFLFMMWIPYFLTYYPGLIFGDSLNSIYQALGKQNWNNHFPIVYSLFVKVFIQLGLILGDLNIGYAIYTLVQMVILSGILAYTVCWLKFKGFSALAVLCCIYFAFEPLFPQHAIAMWKDGIFSAFLLFISIQLFDLVLSKGALIQNRKFCARSIISTIIICFFRNNGIYVIALISVCLGVYTYFNRDNCKEKIRYIFYHCVVIAIVLIVTGPLYGILGIEDEAVEKYGILLQQVARTVWEEGNVGREECDFLNELLPLEKYKELYNPQLVDPIKWDRDFNADFFEKNQREFIITWLKLLTNNFRIYVKAYLEMTYQYWVPNAWENNKFDGNIVYGNVYGVVNETDSWWKLAEVRYCNLLENSWGDTKQLFSITTSMVAVGLLVWFMFLVILYAITKKKGTFILPLVPCIGVLITILIAIPSGYWPRYMLIIYYMLPIIVSMIPIIGRMNLRNNEADDVDYGKDF